MNEPLIRVEDVYFSYADREDRSKAAGSVDGAEPGEGAGLTTGGEDRQWTDRQTGGRQPAEIQSETDTADTDGLVLRGASLEVFPGEFVAILGHNGSGKSTLAKHLNGLLVPRRGAVRVAGLDTSDHRNIGQIRRMVGMVFQHPDNQIIAATVEEDVAFGLENLALPREEMRRRVEDALRRVGMWEYRHRSPHHLSGGQKQRVAIAGVLAMRPACIVLDEATSMLDTPGREEVMAAVRELRAAGVTVVAVTHHMEEAALADRIVVIHEGRVVMQGLPEEVFGRRQEVLAALHLDVPAAAAVSRRIAEVLPGFPMCIRTEELVREVERRVKSGGPAVRTADIPGEGVFSYPGSFGFHAAGQIEGRPTAVRPEPGSECAEDRGEGNRTGQGTGGAADERPGKSADPIIAARGLGYVYMKKTPLEHRALRDVTLSIPRGGVTALVGHTGSGKSTLVQHFNGLIPVQEGHLTVDVSGYADPRRDWKILRTRVGLVFQQAEDQLFERLIGDDVAFGPWRLGLAIDEVRERVRRAMEMVGIPFEWKDRPVYALSGGQRRKVAIAGVLALRPEVLVLDEPTAGLDPRSRDELLEHLLRLNREEGVTLVFITHNLTEVARFADQVILMEGGTAVWSGSPDELFDDPQRCARWNVGVPPHVEVVHRLRERGVAVEAEGYSPDAVAEALIRRLLSEPGVEVGG
ncbi:energy-coupling factor transporter ATPase [Kyrpidia tusciae]|uniref:ABC transporter related protein n=1 Tax=Kyrpidia tusciae (strain DSM 2912 / NBRC 15312 / T2) TaxID=562970 RepID=D5WWA9_KYRT2|nr:energy-coupling factor transporter ATPase [Kyrpidia tusciae]ADG07674.1 ABC transporter related protein [Kyrpidia tusciae DSM 2912]